MNETTQFLKRLMGIRLSANERLMMRERLAAYADMHPVLEGSTPSPFFSFFGAISSRRFSAYALTFLLMIIAGGGITLAAEGSAPGDSLYAIKIHVNEPVMTTLAPTPQAQAQIAADLASRRVDEAVTLASRGTLTPERQEYLSREFTARVAIATKKAEALAASGNTSAAETAKANLAVQLATEAQALGAVSHNDSAESGVFLTAVVTTSEEIAGTGTDEEPVVVAATLAAESTTSDATTSTRSAKMAAPTTTATFKAASMRLPRALRITATTTLRALAPALESSGLLVPKTDHAIPSYTVSGDTSLDSSVANGSDDKNQ